MNQFIQRFAEKITGVISGFDRIVIRGTIRRFGYSLGVHDFLYQNGIYPCNFARYVEPITKRLREASCRAAEKAGRPIIYLQSPKTNKEQLARKVAEDDQIDRGLIAVLSSVEPCMTYALQGDRQTKKVYLVKQMRKCIYLYHYLIHPVFGFMNARIQTWFPFNIQICLNGREWLARTMDSKSIKYCRDDNCIFWVEDFEHVQKLADKQAPIAWFNKLESIARMLNPIYRQIFEKCPVQYYWSAFQTEWATDIIFKDPHFLASIYPQLMHHAMTHLACGDVVRFLGHRPHRNYSRDVSSDFKNRSEVMRVKHRRGQNSVKAYGKHSSTVLRVETTINFPKDMKVYRTTENNPCGQPSWRALRLTVADLPRRAEICQAANERYLDALATVDDSTPLSQLLERISKPTTWKKYRVRGLRPEAGQDLDLIRAVMHAEFTLTGFRNRDLQTLLFKSIPDSLTEKRRRSSKVSRLIRLLRAHHLIRKIPSSYRYMLTPFGTQVLKSILTVQDVTLGQLQKLVA